MFNVVKYDYSVKKSVILKKFTDKRNALQYLEKYAIKYVAKQDGCQKVDDISKYLVNKHELPLRGRNPGHYIVRDIDDHIDKLTIYQKVKLLDKGYIYNSTRVEVKKIFDIDLIQDESEIRPIYPHTWHDEIWYILRDEFAETKTFETLRDCHNAGDFAKCKLSELKKAYPGEFENGELKKTLK